MPNYRRTYLQGGTCFFTVVCYDRQSFLKEEAAIKLLRHCFIQTMNKYPFKVDAMVILPDHLHTIWTLPDDDCDYSTKWKIIKATFSRHYNVHDTGNISESMLRKKEKGIWQRRFWEHLIGDQEDFNRHCDYIHYNPVKHGLVKLPLDWKFSSFRKFVEKGIYPHDWGQSPTRQVIEMDIE